MKYAPVNIALLIGVLFLTHYPQHIIAQASTNFTIGYGFEKIRYGDGIRTIITDYNQHNREENNIATDTLTAPDWLHGIIIGFKLSGEKITSGCELHMPSHQSVAAGTLAIDGSSYYKRIKIGHVGLAPFFGINFFHWKKLRSGPMLGLNLDKYRLMDSEYKPFTNFSYNRYIDRVHLSLSLKWPISIGGNKFSFDIIPYYTMPFWRINLSPFNEGLNEGYFTMYNDNLMIYKPMVFGVSVTLNFVVKIIEE